MSKVIAVSRSIETIIGIYSTFSKQKIRRPKSVAVQEKQTNVDKGREGVKKSENVMDVIYGSSLVANDGGVRRRRPPEAVAQAEGAHASAHRRQKLGQLRRVVICAESGIEIGFLCSAKCLQNSIKLKKDSLCSPPILTPSILSSVLDKLKRGAFDVEIAEDLLSSELIVRQDRRLMYVE